MNISFTPELEDLDQTKVTSLEKFRSEVDRRLRKLDQGAGIDGEAVFGKIREKSEERRRDLASLIERRGIRNHDATD